MPGKHSYPYSFQIQQPKDFCSFFNFLTMVMAGIGVALVTTYYSNYMPFLSCCSAYIYWLEVFFGSDDRNGKFEYLVHIISPTYEGEKMCCTTYELSCSWCDPQPSKLTDWLSSNKWYYKKWKQFVYKL